jgi:hypothetical protein
MKPTRLFALATAVRLAALLSVLFPAVAASQDETLTVTLQRNGQSMTPRSVALYGATGIKNATVAANTATFPADPIAASLEGKPVGVFVDECDDGQIRVHLVPDDQNVLPPPEEDDCRRRRIGGFVFRRGAKIAVDIARRTVVDLSMSASAGASHAGHQQSDRFSVYAVGGSNFGSFWNMSDADPTLRVRYGNAAYDRFENRFVESDVSWGAGGGIRWAFTRRVGLDAGFMYQDLGKGQLSTTGTRINGNLLFSLDAVDRFSTRTVLGGVTLSPAEWLAVTIFAGQTWWTNELRITDSLFGRTPQVRLQGGDVTEERSGSDPTFGARVSVPIFKRVHAFYQFNRTTFKGAHVADGPSALPADITQGSHLSGLQICMSFKRR